eukprot:TRINITY_DN3473_c0_g1_i2.p1 TRINITY_DN3473_c0_g1~~TRINITY_DN3473_c0_g1_i2.p1  ORF type:complete len:244 (-),score=4.21 TRINITY_DN3473_c0_g1_i2:223-954(-)
MPIVGNLQTITAIHYFRFLPSRKDPGYYSDKGVLSYQFICENLFFSLLLTFQWLYYNDLMYVKIQNFWPLEAAFVFLPYIWRPLFPKTSFRESLKNSKKNTTSNNSIYYYYATWVTKIFYVWAKHYLGFFLNYLRFVGGVTPQIQYLVYMLLIPSAFATTISLFLHTLRFKKYIYPLLSFSLYVIAYSSTFIAYVKIVPVFLEHYQLFLISLGGVILNFVSLNIWHVYQIGIMFLGYSGYLAA